MIPALLAVLLSQAPSTPPLTVPPEAPVAAPALEAVKAGSDEPAEVKLFAQFVDRHLLTLDPDMSQGTFRLRQRERVFSFKDEDFADAFKLVPEAHALAVKAQENLRMSSFFQIAGLSSVGAGSALVLLAPLLASTAFVPLLIAGLVLDIVGVVLVLVALPFAISAQTQFMSAVATYNKGLLDLRPVGEAPARPAAAAGGLTIPLP